MGYPPFNLTTLQLVAPTANMTKAEYKDAYGIDLDDVNIKAFKLVLFGGEKYAIDQIKEVEAGIEIYFNGRIMSITDIVQVSDEVYNVANSVPIFWHGLDLYASGYTTSIQAHILNNSSAPINTIAKLDAWFKSISGDVNLSINGYVRRESKNWNVWLLRKNSNNTYTFYGHEENEVSYSSFTVSDISDIVTNISDATNKIN